MCALRYFVRRGTSDLFRTWRSEEGWKRGVEVEGVGRKGREEERDMREKDERSELERWKKAISVALFRFIQLGMPGS